MKVGKICNSIAILCFIQRHLIPIFFFIPAHSKVNCIYFKIRHDIEFIKCKIKTF